MELVQYMRRPLGASALFHLAVLTAGYISLPYLRDSLPPLETTIVVDFVNIEVAEKTNIPPKPALQEPKPEPPKAPPPPPQASTPPPPPPPAPTQTASVTPPAPKEAVEPAPKPDAKLPEPKPVEAKPEPKPESKPQIPVELTKAKPQKKPTPPDPFASVLKTVDNLKPTAKKEEEKKPAKPQENFQDSIQKVLASSKAPFNPNNRITISDMDLLQSQIRECWQVPAGGKDAGSLITDIRVWMNQNGTVQKAEIQNTAQIFADPYRRSMAESALRAVLNPRCQPFKLPPEKYSEWNTLVLTFNPKDMF